MKNVRFGSGFLHVSRKLIPQQDPDVSIALKPFVSEIYKSASSYRHGVQATNIESHECLSTSRRMQYLIFNWRQLGENIADPWTSTPNSSRTVENQTNGSILIIDRVEILKRSVYIWICFEEKNFSLN